MKTQVLWLGLIAAALVAVCNQGVGVALACPFCAPSGNTLSNEVAQADMILYGSLANARLDPQDSGFNKGTTDFHIEVVIKPHEIIKGKKTITLPRYIPPEGKGYKYLIFFNVSANGELDPYRGDAFPPDSRLPEYLKGAIAVRNKDAVTRLKYFFQYLEDKDVVISSDAYNEFAQADYKEIREVAPHFPPETLLKWLADPNTRGSRYGLYGLLLGHCGKPEHARALRQLLDDKERNFASGLDGVLAGYILLAPQEGWKYLRQLIRDDQEFPIKYAVLRTARYFWEYRPDVIPQTQVLEVMQQLIAQPDIADMPIEDLRKWRQWQLTPLILSYAEKPSHKDIPINMRAILKFALAAAQADPKNAAAAAFVAKARQQDPKRVEFLEELLKDEQRLLQQTSPMPTETSSPKK
ncbi:MAG: hypothetical protein NZU63_12165 [Gemmataceae bacterium]|nr:hypothetical protein [Gemmataceae bacterium]MDW8244357.1 hypothetical protein [Thermogemmata sp.]